MSGTVQDSKGVTKINTFKEESTERESSTNNCNIGLYRLLQMDKFPVP